VRPPQCIASSSLSGLYQQCRSNLPPQKKIQRSCVCTLGGGLDQFTERTSPYLGIYQALAVLSQTVFIVSQLVSVKDQSRRPKLRWQCLNASEWVIFYSNVQIESVRLLSCPLNSISYSRFPFYVLSSTSFQAATSNFFLEVKEKRKYLG
jgi:hypothetical protein